MDLGFFLCYGRDVMQDIQLLSMYYDVMQNSLVH